MARNEEKQLGKLNRLWLQKEREEGRIKDVHVPRPKLATLNSVAAVKKWIPSIKNEIEYYLQQSQLSHYPERKIAEFQQQIERLEKEYKAYLNKLRFLDPSCKHQLWSPRAYTKRRTDSNGDQCTGKRLCAPDSGVQTSYQESCATATKNKLDICNSSEPDPTHRSDLPDQDLPLSFDHSRLAIAVAGSRVASSGQQNERNTLAHVLHKGLPNLHSSALTQVPGLAESKQTEPLSCTEGSNHTTNLHLTTHSVLMQTPENAACKTANSRKCTHTHRSCFMWKLLFLRGCL
ncbi:uncharacterized protein si:dkey-86e18.1 isoform X1 [Hemibagrus wyckioides]|uniref:uncharacterized protein si:dkey-86e18.1 isoform X1 n=1 Tax=Hemibagrus wyckioides TaxID=337641 RepID=UPI00266B5F68|nr:uncharacterized protein si:dkey-86e18.1 isoform X1 [Hemibagrus wyckioides]